MFEGRLPTVPEYYQEFINKEVNLVAAPKQCCPFHKENTPSFSYNVATGRWACFGKCHTSGDVIDMHQRTFHMESRAEAEADLRAKCGMSITVSLEDLVNKEEYISENDIENEVVYLEAVQLANTPERWLELDYVMSKSPYERVNLQELIYKWKGGPQI